MQSGALPHSVMAAPGDGRTPLHSPLPSLIPYPEAAFFLYTPATFCHTPGMLLGPFSRFDRRPAVHRESRPAMRVVFAGGPRKSPHPRHPCYAPPPVLPRHASRRALRVMHAKYHPARLAGACDADSNPVSRGT
jgi:hypothetical protein